MVRLLTIWLALLLTGPVAAWADSDLAKQVVAEFVNVAEYDLELCATAQRMLVNADEDRAADEFSIFLERAPGGVFATEQMDIDPDSRRINVAMATVTVTVDGESLATHVACKMVNRDRVNDVLQLQLTGPPRSCRDVNERTYRIALAMLSPEDRRRFEATGKPLRFVDDYVAGAGGEWLPSVVNDFIRSENAEQGPLQVDHSGRNAEVDDGRCVDRRGRDISAAQAAVHRADIDEFDGWQLRFLLWPGRFRFLPGFQWTGLDARVSPGRL